jgi:hypothetical protein
VRGDMNKLKIGIGIVIVFVLGILTGVLGTRIIVEQRLEKFAKGGPPAVRVLEKYSSRLDLNESQKKEIEKIILQTSEKLRKHRKKFRPEFEKIMNENFAMMKEHLNNDQKEELEKMIQEMKRRGYRKPFRKGRQGFRKHKNIDDKDKGLLPGNQN